jgi:hypothetical protein
MQLERFLQDSLELVINTSTGECFAGRNALARMCGVSSATISKWKGESQIETISAEIPTAGGVQGGHLFDEEAIFNAFEKYKPELLKVCAKAGIRMYLHQLAGYKFVPVQSDSAMLSEILAIVKQQRDEFMVFKAESEKFKAEVRPQLARLERIETATEQLPGLKQILEELQNNPPKPEEKTFKLKDILFKLGYRHLDNGKRKKVGRQIADWLKLHELKLPEKKNGATLYKECYIPLVYFAVQQLAN